MGWVRHALAGLGRGWVGRALIACGAMYVTPPLTGPAGPDGPAPGHPERLRPDLPLGAAESLLWAELMADRRFRSPT
ncbi:DUF6059 family protein [Streptomyces sp. NPDC050256]|uniref:DUF6059 family protein n=1 Tax=Streptomyces sp. NPDC050256 TaxID=3365607 RepID=UPI0037A65E87